MRTIAQASTTNRGAAVMKDQVANAAKAFLQHLHAGLQRPRDDGRVRVELTAGREAYAEIDDRQEDARAESNHRLKRDECGEDDDCDARRGEGEDRGHDDIGKDVLDALEL